MKLSKITKIDKNHNVWKIVFCFNKKEQYGDSTKQTNREIEIWEIKNNQDW